jgi:hypothetical protein
VRTTGRSPRPGIVDRGRRRWRGPVWHDRQLSALEPSRRLLPRCCASSPERNGRCAFRGAAGCSATAEFAIGRSKPPVGSPRGRGFGYALFVICSLPPREPDILTEGPSTTTVSPTAGGFAYSAPPDAAPKVGPHPRATTETKVRMPPYSQAVRDDHLSWSKSRLSARQGTQQHRIRGAPTSTAPVHASTRAGLPRPLALSSGPEVPSRSSLQLISLILPGPISAGRALPAPTLPPTPSRVSGNLHRTP